MLGSLMAQYSTYGVDRWQLLCSRLWNSTRRQCVVRGVRTAWLTEAAIVVQAAARRQKAIRIVGAMEPLWLRDAERALSAGEEGTSLRPQLGLRLKPWMWYWGPDSHVESLEHREQAVRAREDALALRKAAAQIGAHCGGDRP